MLEHCFDVLLGYDCNVKCRFCSQELSWRKRKSVAFQDVSRILFQARQLGHRQLGLLGGEITLRSDLPKILAFAKKVGFESIRILTNGLKLADFAYAKKLIDYGLSDIYFSVHGHNAKLHDFLVAAPGAFRKVTIAMNNLDKLGVQIGVKVLVNKKNAGSLSHIVLHFSKRQNVAGIDFTFPLYTGDFLNHAAQMRLTWTQAVGPIRRAVDALRKRPLKRAPALHNLPACLAPDLAALNTDLLPETTALGNAMEAAGTGATSKQHVAACASCSVKKRCPGVDPGYLSQWGEREIKPIPLETLKTTREHVRGWRFEEAISALLRAFQLPAVKNLELGLEPEPLQDLLLESRRPQPGAPLRLALGAVEAADALWPSQPELLILKACLEIRLGAGDPALAALERASALEPGLAAAPLLKFLAKNSALEPVRSVDAQAEMKAELDLAARLDPKNKLVWLWRAELLHDLELALPALEDLDCALDLDPENIWAHVEKAEILSEINRFEESAAEYDWLKKRLPRAGWILAMRARAAAKCGREKEALRDFNAALKIDASLPNVWAWRGELHRKLGRLDLALKDLSKSLRMEPRNSYAKLWRAKTYLCAERWADALRDLDAAIAFDSRHLNLFILRAQALLMKGRFKEGINDLERAFPLNPRTSWTPHGGRGREASLFADLSVLARRYPNSPWPFALRGRVRIEDPSQNVREQGLADLNLALELESDCAWALGWRGRALASLPDLNRAVELEPSGRHLAWRGRLLHDLGRRSEALLDLEQAFCLLPQAGWIAEGLGRLKAELGAAGAQRDLELSTLLDAKS